MFRKSILQSCPWTRWAFAAAITVAVATLTVNPAFADPPGVQLEDFYWNDGTQVISDGGMPFAHAAIYRFYDRPRDDGICWDLMTVGLTPSVGYDIWLEGSNDGTDDGAFAWWLGRAKATGQGDLNRAGYVFTGNPPGPHFGSFTNARAEFYLVIRTTSGERVQAAFYPEW